MNLKFKTYIVPFLLCYIISCKEKCDDPIIIKEYRFIAIVLEPDCGTKIKLIDGIATYRELTELDIKDSLFYVFNLPLNPNDTILFEGKSSKTEEMIVCNPLTPKGPYLRQIKITKFKIL